MATKKLSKEHKIALLALGKRIRFSILTNKSYKSLDAFSLEYHDLITKPTLYQICDGKRDMKLSTLMSLSSALATTVNKLLEDL